MFFSSHPIHLLLQDVASIMNALNKKKCSAWVRWLVLFVCSFVQFSNIIHLILLSCSMSCFYSVCYLELDYPISNKNRTHFEKMFWTTFLSFFLSLYCCCCWMSSSSLCFFFLRLEHQLSTIDPRREHMMGTCCCCCCRIRGHLINVADAINAGWHTMPCNEAFFALIMSGLRPFLLLITTNGHFHYKASLSKLNIYLSVLRLSWSFNIKAVPRN